MTVLNAARMNLQEVLGGTGPLLLITDSDLYTGTQVETPDTAKWEPNGRAPARYPDRRLTGIGCCAAHSTRLGRASRLTAGKIIR
jgi:hypothetical protein